MAAYTYSPSWCARFAPSSPSGDLTASDLAVVMEALGRYGAMDVDEHVRAYLAEVAETEEATAFAVRIGYEEVRRVGAFRTPAAARKCVDRLRSARNGGRPMFKGVHADATGVVLTIGASCLTSHPAFGKAIQPKGEPPTGERRFVGLDPADAAGFRSAFTLPVLLRYRAWSDARSEVGLPHRAAVDRRELSWIQLSLSPREVGKTLGLAMIRDRATYVLPMLERVRIDLKGVDVRMRVDPRTVRGRVVMLGIDLDRVSRREPHLPVPEVPDEPHATVTPVRTLPQGAVARPAPAPDVAPEPLAPAFPVPPAEIVAEPVEPYEHEARDRDDEVLDALDRDLPPEPADDDDAIATAFAARDDGEEPEGGYVDADDDREPDLDPEEGPEEEDVDVDEAALAVAQRKFVFSPPVEPEEEPYVPGVLDPDTVDNPEPARRLANGGAPDLRPYWLCRRIDSEILPGVWADAVPACPTSEILNEQTKLGINVWTHGWYSWPCYVEDGAELRAMLDQATARRRWVDRQFERASYRGGGHEDEFDSETEPLVGAERFDGDPTEDWEACRPDKWRTTDRVPGTANDRHDGIGRVDELGEPVTVDGTRREDRTAREEAFSRAHFRNGHAPHPGRDYLAERMVHHGW